MPVREFHPLEPRDFWHVTKRPRTTGVLTGSCPEPPLNNGSFSDAIGGLADEDAEIAWTVSLLRCC